MESIEQVIIEPHDAETEIKASFKEGITRLEKIAHGVEAFLIEASASATKSNDGGEFLERAIIRKAVLFFIKEYGHSPDLTGRKRDRDISLIISLARTGLKFTESDLLESESLPLYSTHLPPRPIET